MDNDLPAYISAYESILAEAAFRAFSERPVTPQAAAQMRELLNRGSGTDPAVTFAAFRKTM